MFYFEEPRCGNTPKERSSLVPRRLSYHGTRSDCIMKGRNVGGESSAVNYILFRSAVLSTCIGIFVKKRL